MWREGERTLPQLAAQYGAEVVELLQAQKAVAEAEDAERAAATSDGPESTAGQGSFMMRGQCPLLAPGCPRVQFGFSHSGHFGHHSSIVRTCSRLRVLGTLWMELFRMWRTWGLESIYADSWWTVAL